MTDPTTTKQLIGELNTALAEYEEAYRSLKKKIGWLPRSIQYAVKRQIEECVDNEFLDDQPKVIDYDLWKEP